MYGWGFGFEQFAEDGAGAFRAMSSYPPDEVQQFPRRRDHNPPYVRPPWQEIHPQACHRPILTFVHRFQILVFSSIKLAGGFHIDFIQIAIHGAQQDFPGGGCREGRVPRDALDAHPLQACERFGLLRLGVEVEILAQGGVDDQVGGRWVQEHAADQAHLGRFLGQVDVCRAEQC